MRFALLECHPWFLRFRVFEPGGRPGPRRRRRRVFPTFETEGVATAFFFCAALSATAFGGRPGPPGRHVPRVLRRRLRPFFGFVVGIEMLPSNDWMAERTS